MRIGLLTCLWRRSRLARMVLEYTSELKVPGVELVPVAVWSPYDEEAPGVYNLPGWHFVRWPNEPVSDKWNAGARAMKALDVDAMMIFGSDDFLNAALLEAVARRIAGGADYVALKSLYFFDLASKACIYCQTERIGGARTLSRAALERLAWRPWRSGFNRGIDGAMDLRMASIERPPEPVYIEDIRAEHAVLLAVKSEENLWDFEHMRGGIRHEVVDAAGLLDEHLSMRQARTLMKPW